MTLDQFHQRAAGLLHQGAPLPAYDVAAAGLRAFPGDVALRRLLALALARSGAGVQANAVLAQLIDEGHRDEETVGMFARTFKDLWASAGDIAEARRHLEHAAHWYSVAHQLSGGYWSGINAATMALLLDDQPRASSLARQMRELCLRRQADGGPLPDGYWIGATLGEAALILGEYGLAADSYRKAAADHPHGIGDLVATRRNARLILRHQQVDRSEIESCFHIPRVAVFAGHLIDRPDRDAPRFPAALEDDVRAALLGVLRRCDIGTGYASAANGGDLLFLECLNEIGADSHIVLPYNRDQFLIDSVSFVPGWSVRFQAALDRATHVVTASEQRMPRNATSYEYGFRLLDGSAALRAEELDTDLVSVAVWDGASGDGPGGTAAAIDYWRSAGRRIEIIDLRGIADAAARQHSSPPAIVTARQPSIADIEPAIEAQIVGLLFADVAGFSKLAEDQIPNFVDRYMGAIGRVLEQFPDRPLLVNTWGDGLYVVFAGVKEAGAFALQLSTAMRDIDWTSHGLPETLGLRIAVHAGPAYAVTDPVTGRRNYVGAHVSFAARIEPITPAGVVYGSGAFAALAKSGGVRDFACTYVGPTPLAKDAGTTSMYVLRPVVTTAFRT